VSAAARPLRQVVVALAMVSALMATPVHAGQNCVEKPPSTEQIRRSLDLAVKTVRWLDASGARLVVIARRGQNLDRYGVRYSHLGYVYRDEAAKAWRVVHKLNQCGTAESALYRQGLAEFFSDDLFDFEAALVVPTPAVQDALRPLLQDNDRAAVLHHKPYSMVAYPWSQRYQQSNQWALETLACAVEPGACDRTRAQAWLQFKGYQPTTLNLSAGQRLGARVGTANVAFDDHPSARRFSDRIDTVTVDSVFTFLQHTGLAGAPQTVR
jgi:hypothetical protein